MSIWGALGFMGLGMAIGQIYNWMAWKKYYEGKREQKDERRGLK